MAPDSNAAPLPLAVLADDLTGAAETAALGWACGRRACVLTAPTDLIGHPECVVVDTDTRLELPQRAAATVRAAARLPVVQRAGLVFKKTDSVLRGPVRAELEASAAARGATRVLLAPANPALGRAVREGRYFVHDVPVSQTAFGRDPHHPIVSDDVVAMLGAAGEFPVYSLRRHASLPARGIALVDATTEDDLRAWGRRLDRETLPAGAAGFLRAILEVNGWTARTGAVPAPMAGSWLILSGTITPAPVPAGATFPQPLVLAMPEAVLVHSDERDRWTRRVAAALSTHRIVQVVTTGLPPMPPPGPGQVRRAFAALAAALHREQALAHLLVEGGATASAIVRHLGWAQLDVVHEWAQGVVSLRPPADSRVQLTMKPGSYPWPEALWKHVPSA